MKKRHILDKVEIRTSYDGIYAENSYLSEVDSLYRWVLDVLRPKLKSRVLDIACGTGKLVRIATQRNIVAFGVDISIVALKLALESGSPDHLFCVGDGEKLPFPKECFDYVTNIGSLEHFLDIEGGLREMHRVLKPNGIAAILLPNNYYLVDILWKVLRTGYSPTHKQVVERFATYNEWKDLIEANGFKVNNGYKYNRFFPRNIAELKWYLKFPNRFVEAIIAPLIPRNLSYHFLYICQKED